MSDPTERLYGLPGAERCWVDPATVWESDIEPCPGSGMPVDAEPGCHVRCPECGVDTLVDGWCGVDGCAWCRYGPALIDHTREVDR